MGILTNIRNKWTGYQKYQRRIWARNDARIRAAMGSKRLTVVELSRSTGMRRPIIYRHLYDMIEHDQASRDGPVFWLTPIPQPQIDALNRIVSNLSPGTSKIMIKAEIGPLWTGVIDAKGRTAYTLPVDSHMTVADTPLKKRRSGRKWIISKKLVHGQQNTT